jgi:phosphoribosylanthranilate isomerase
VSAEIKFCGLTRPEDAAYAVSLGAAYVGVIFAGGPRTLTPERAANVLRDVPASVRRVGVFANHEPREIADLARELQLGVVQIHTDTSSDTVTKLRAMFDGDIWIVARVAHGALPTSFAQSVNAGDGVLLDALVPGALGGTGVPIAWSEVSRELEPFRGKTRFILAGGLRPENVAEAVRALAPDVVDVSSGVERSPGIKDYDRMRAFRDAVTQASITI